MQTAFFFEIWITNLALLQSQWKYFVTIIHLNSLRYHSSITNVLYKFWPDQLWFHNRDNFEAWQFFFFFLYFGNSILHPTRKCLVIVLIEYSAKNVPMGTNTGVTSDIANVLNKFGWFLWVSVGRKKWIFGQLFMSAFPIMRFIRNITRMINEQIKISCCNSSLRIQVRKFINLFVRIQNKSC